MNWILIIYIYAGVLAQGDSVALTNIQGFTSESVCIAAGRTAEKLTVSSSKVYRFVCVKGSE